MEDRYDIQWSTGPRRVAYNYITFSEFDPERSCASCTLDATVRLHGCLCARPAHADNASTQIIGPNVNWAGMMEAMGWNDMELMLGIVPVRGGSQHLSPFRGSPPAPVQATVTSLLGGIDSVLGGMLAAEPSVRFIFPELAARDNSSWALSQWAACGVIGAPLYSLHSAIIDEALPYPPEFCGWAQANLGLSQADASLPLPVAQVSHGGRPSEHISDALSAAAGLPGHAPVQ